MGPGKNVGNLSAGESVALRTTHSEEDVSDEDLPPAGYVISVSMELVWAGTLRAELVLPGNNNSVLQLFELDWSSTNCTGCAHRRACLGLLRPSLWLLHRA